MTLPSEVRRSFVRTNAPPLPGLTCWNSITLKMTPSTSMWLPFLSWLVLITLIRVSRAVRPALDYDRRMHSRPAALRASLLAATVALSVGAGLGATARPADAVIIGVLTTYPVAVDVDLTITQRSSWKGIRPGCFAPAENFDITYQLEIDSTPRGRASRIRAGTATLGFGSVGVTPSYGDRGSFRQFSSAAPWELQIRNPGSCPAASAVPPWASSPTCKRIAERVATSFQMEPNRRDGRLTVMRVPKQSLAGRGASIGPSCFRALGSVDAIGISSYLAVSERSTIASIPIRDLRGKLEAMAEGPDDARLSFRLPVTIGGDCTAMRMKPSIGDLADFTKSPFWSPHKALGNPADRAKAATCTVTGRGDFLVRRAGRVVRTSIRPRPLSFPPSRGGFRTFLGHDPPRGDRRRCRTVSVADRTRACARSAPAGGRRRGAHDPAQSTTCRSFGSVLRTSAPSSVTTTRSSIRTPQRPGT